jgi:hypothetical protein
MKIMSGFSRRGFLKGLAAVGGAAVGSRIPGASWIPEAHAAGEPAAVVIVHFIGGYNSIFGSAKELQGSFGVTAGNYTDLGGGVSLDNTMANSFSAFVKQHAAVVGVRHQQSAHGPAQVALWSYNGQNAGLHLASAMGGSASIKAAVVGGTLKGNLPRTAVGGVSFQAITDMATTIDALGGGAPNPRVPDRGIAVSGMTNAEKMSANALQGSPESLESLTNGYKAAIDTLKQPVQQFNYDQLKTAYTLGNSTAVTTFKAKLAAAELMVRAGTNVVTLFDEGWDSHGDSSGNEVRNKMTGYVLTPLNMFLNRMVADTTRNVTVVLMGDFARSRPNSGHQPNLSALVLGRNLKTATTGKVNSDVVLPANTPSTQGLWSLLQTVSGAAQKPFGTNLHPTLVA